MKFIENDRNGLTPEEYEKQRQINNAKKMSDWESDLMVYNGQSSFNEYPDNLRQAYVDDFYEQNLKGTITMYEEMYQKAAASNNVESMNECLQVISYLKSKLNDNEDVKKSVK